MKKKSLERQTDFSDVSDDSEFSKQEIQKRRAMVNSKLGAAYPKRKFHNFRAQPADMLTPENLKRAARKKK